MKVLPFALTTIALAISGCGSSDNEQENQLPEITLQSSYSGPENTELTITASASDPDGNIADYAWEITSGDAQIISGSNASTLTLALPAVENDSTISLSLTVTDDDNASTTSDTTIEVMQVSPVIDDIPSVTASEKSALTLTASASVASGEIASYNWIQTSGPESEFSGQDTASLSVVLPEVSSDQTLTFDVTVTDDDGDEVTSTANVSVTQTTMSLVVNGLATDAPLENAEITVMLNGEDYMDGITTDADGNFTFNIIVDDSMGDAFVSIKAEGTGEQAAAGLISLLASFDSLVEDSGDDGELTASENPATTVSNITTAKYALLKKVAEENQSIFDEATIATLSEQVNPQEVITLATAIKVAIDKANSQQTTLPDSIANTLELVENEEATQAYSEAVINTTEFQDAQQEIFDDPTLFAPAAEFGDSFTFYGLPASDLTSYSRVNYFFADGSGQDSGNGFNWNADGSSIQIEYDGSEGASSYSYIGSEQVRAVTVPVSKTYTLISENGETLDLKTDYSYEIQYPDNPEIASESYSTTSFETVKQASLPVELLTPAIAYVGLPSQSRNAIVLQDDEQAYSTSNYEKFIFSSNGTADAEVSNQQVNWSLNDGVLTITGFNLDSTTSSSINVELISNRNGADILHTVAIKEDGSPDYDLSFTAYGFLSEPQRTWNEESIAGVYGYDTVLGESELDDFWFELKEDGKAYTVSTSDRDGNGVLEETEVTIYSGGWQINENGDLEITRYFDAGSYSPSASCFEESEDCLLYNLRTWELLDVVNDAYTLAHTHDFKYDSVYHDGSPDYITKDIRIIRKNVAVPYDISEMTGN